MGDTVLVCWGCEAAVVVVIDDVVWDGEDWDRAAI